MMVKIIAIVIFVIGLWYVILPAPKTINDIPGVPNSIKSNEPGDTIQNPNIAAYYTDYRRAAATQFYRQQFQKLHCQSFSFLNPFCIIPPLRVNLPIEYAFLRIRDQQQSTYLEEYVYPFKDSLYVNGYEPYDINGKPFSSKSYPIMIQNKFFDSKVTIRFYPSSVFVRTLVYVLTWISIWWLVLLTKNIVRKRHG